MLRARLQSADWQRFGVILMWGLALLGILARLAPIVAHRFHPDEAIYSQWALQVTTGRDPWLGHFPVDKPPLFIYVLALFFNVFGPSESVARLPSELASAFSLLLTYRLARRLYGRPTAVVALALMAISPLNILFAPTAFTDPLMTALVLAALWLAARRDWAWSGGALGLAFICKPQAALFLPLVVAFNLLSARSSSEPPDNQTSTVAFGRLRSRWAAVWAGWPAPVRNGLAFAASFGVAVVPAFVWDAFRAQRPGFLEQSAISYGGLAWAPVAQWPERADQWRAILGYVTASPLLDTMLIAGALVLLTSDWLRRPVGFETLRRARIDLCLVVFTLFFLGVHIVVNFNVWDRYMLSLVPCLLLLLARVLTLPWELGAGRPRFAPLRAGCGVGVAVLLVLTTLRPVEDAAAGRYPIGGDHGAYDGLTELVAYFRGHVPGGSIVYHQWLGWHYSFYMFDFPYQFQWYTTPEELAAHAAAHPNSPRFVAFPSWTSSTPVAWRLKQAGLALRPLYETYRDDGSASFTLYRIEEIAP